MTNAAIVVVNLSKRYGARSAVERVWLNCAGDWGHSDPLAVPKTAVEMRRRGHTPARIDRLIYQNPRRFLSQCPKFEVGMALRAGPHF